MATTPRLTIAQANFHNLWGGQAEVVLALSKALRARGHRLLVVTPPGSILEKRAQQADLEVFNACSFRKGFHPLAQWREASALGHFLAANQADICHCHGSQDHWTAALALRHSPKTRLVRTRHNIYPVRNHIFNRWLFRTQTARVITIFSGQAPLLCDSGLLQPDRLETIHSPLPEEFYASGPVQPVLRKELGLAEDVPLVGFCASFHPDKAPLNFTAAAAQVARNFPKAHFCMAGLGPLLETVRAQVKELGLAERFHVLGFRQDIAAVMASFDLLVLPSVTREASSTVLKQAGALGKPVVTTDVGGSREIVVEGKTGLIVKPGDVPALTAAIEQILAHPDQAAAMGQAGKERVLGEYTVEAIAARTEACYLRVLQAPVAKQL